MEPSSLSGDSMRLTQSMSSDMQSNSRKYLIDCRDVMSRLLKMRPPWTERLPKLAGRLRLKFSF